MKISKDSGPPYDFEAALTAHPKSMGSGRQYSSGNENIRRLQVVNDPLRSLNRARLAALGRLQQLGKCSHWGADALFKIFPYVDTLLFDGALRGMATIRWSFQPLLP